MRIDMTDYKAPPPGSCLKFFFGLTCLLSLLPLLLFTGCTNKPAVFGPCLTISGLENESTTQKAGSGVTERFGSGDSSQPSITQKILASAYSQMGKSYKGTGPGSAFDSGEYTAWVFAQHGINLPKTAQGQAESGTVIKRSDLRPGDLILYWYNRAARSMHVGIYTGGGKYIHCANLSGRIEEASAFDMVVQTKFIEARRVVEDPLAAPLPVAQKETIIQQAAIAYGPTKIASNVTSPKSSQPTNSNATSESASTSQVDSVEEVVAKVQAQQAQANSDASRPKAANLFRRTAPAAPATAPRKPSNLSGRVTPGNAKPATSNKPAPSGKNYQTKAGDTIYTVAQRFGVSPSSLIQANHLGSAQTLRTGQTLSIP